MLYYSCGAEMWDGASVDSLNLRQARRLLADLSATMREYQQISLGVS